MIVFTTFHKIQFQQLASHTFHRNKKVYCQKHQYPLLCKTDDWHEVPAMYEKVYLVLDAIEKYPDCQWIFYSNCDTLITNMNIRLEYFVKDQPENIHLVIGSDLNGINAGNFFFRNSPETQSFLKTMLQNIGKFDTEQDYLMDAWNGSQHWRQHIDVRPQREFNAYDYSIYEIKHGEKRAQDWFGNDGNWQEGDFLLHLVCCTNQERIQLLTDIYIQYVVY